MITSHAKDCRFDVMLFQTVTESYVIVQSQGKESKEIKIYNVL